MGGMNVFMTVWKKLLFYADAGVEKTMIFTLVDLKLSIIRKNEKLLFFDYSLRDTTRLFKGAVYQKCMVLSPPYLEFLNFFFSQRYPSIRD